MSRRWNRLKRCARLGLAHIDGVLFGLDDEHRVARLVWGCVAGVLFAYVFWMSVLSDLGISERYDGMAYIGLLLFLGIGYPISAQIRCTCLLICVGFFGRAGRSYMKAILYGLIIAGPIYNITLNCKEVVRVFGCSAKLTYNLTKNRFDLLTAPFRRSLQHLSHNVTHINRSFEKIKNVVQPLRDEIEGTDGDESNNTVNIQQRQADVPPDSKLVLDSDEADAIRIRANYMDKIRGRCQLQLDRGQQRCRSAFHNAYERCMKKLPMVVDTLLCWPMQVTVVCKAVLSKGGDICNPSASLDASMGHDYVELNQTMRMMSAVKINVSAAGAQSMMSRMQQKTKETSAHILRDFDQKWHLVSAYLFILRKVLALMFLRVVKNAMTYRRKYLREIDFDNVYVSNYFLHLEKRRAQNGQRTLLPLKKIEQSPLMRPTSCHRSRREFWIMLAQLVKATLEILVAATFLLLDHLLAVGMQIVAEHARIEFVQEGEHIVHIRVNGTGIIAQLVRQSAESANFEYSMNMTTDNEQCLPRPNYLDSAVYWRILAMYLLIMFLIYIETYLQRMRHCIAAYFYFKREKQRVLHVYNQTMKKRRGLLRQIMAEIEEQLRADGRSAIWYGGLCHRVPMCWWLRWMEVCRRVCIICKDPEPFRSEVGKVVECGLCRTLYCLECWREVGEVCLVCQCVTRKRGGGNGPAEDWWYNDQSPYASDASDYDL